MTTTTTTTMMMISMPPSLSPPPPPPPPRPSPPPPSPSLPPLPPCYGVIADGTTRSGAQFGCRVLGEPACAVAVASGAAPVLTLAECCASILPYSGGACEAVELADGFDGGGGSGSGSGGGLCGGGDGSDKPAADADGGANGNSTAALLVDPLTGPQGAIVGVGLGVVVGLIVGALLGGSGSCARLFARCCPQSSRAVTRTHAMQLGSWRSSRDLGAREQAPAGLSTVGV